MDEELLAFYDRFFSGAGGEVDECNIALRFYDDELSPETITGLLGVPPTLSARKGAIRPNGNGVYPTGLWCLECERTVDTADHQIRLLLGIDLPQ